jgi:hypothetical protein
MKEVTDVSRAAWFEVCGMMIEYGARGGLLGWSGILLKLRKAGLKQVRILGLIVET